METDIIPNDQARSPLSRPVPSEEHIAVIRELNLIFPPTMRNSDEDNEARILLVASTVAHVPIRWLRTAAIEWPKSKSFMPKASELINLARDLRDKHKKAPASSLQDWCDRQNEAMDEITDQPRLGRWIAIAGQAKLIPVAEFRNREARISPPPFTSRELDRIAEHQPDILKMGLNAGFLEWREGVLFERV